MTFSCVLCVFLISLRLGICSSSFFDWFSASSNDMENSNDKIQTDFSIPRIKTNGKFLEEANKHLALSPIDICQYTIMLKLKSSCSDLSEEALLKMSVSLLNCQSEVEGRKQVFCTEHMSLKECTKAMDTSTWNLYHMMSVRAKSVCYLTRQQQFNAYSDMMLKKLVDVAHDQIATMDLLEDGQEKLQFVATKILTFVDNAHENLKLTERQVFFQKKRLEDALSTNILAIKAHASLIAEAQGQFTTFVEDIKKTIDASGPSVVNGTHIKQLQSTSFSMIGKFQKNLEILSKNIDAELSAVDILLLKIRLQKENLVSKVATISSMMNFVYTFVEELWSHTTINFNWLFGLICNADNQTTQNWCCMQHALLLVGSLLLSLLLQLGVCMFAMIIHTNFIIYYWYRKQLLIDSEVTMQMFLFIIGQWFVLKLCTSLINKQHFLVTTASSVVDIILLKWSHAKHLITNR